MAGVTSGSSAGLGPGGLALAGPVALAAGSHNGGAANASTLGGGLLCGAGAHGQYGDAEHKLYLESTVLERKIPEADLRQLIDLPPGLDLNEWLASHSKSFSFIITTRPFVFLVRFVAKKIEGAGGARHSSCGFDPKH